jgi:hypothetical protein
MKHSPIANLTNPLGAFENVTYMIANRNMNVITTSVTNTDFIPQSSGEFSLNPFAANPPTSNLDFLLAIK